MQTPRRLEEGKVYELFFRDEIESTFLLLIESRTHSGDIVYRAQSRTGRNKHGPTMTHEAGILRSWDRIVEVPIENWLLAILEN